MTKARVEVKNLKKYFYSGVLRKKEIKAVDGVSFEIKEGKTLGLVGESGCGKTTVGRTILRLINPTEGEIIFDGGDITSMNGRELKKLGREMQIIFQNPESSLNPRMNIYDSIAEPLSIHKICNKNEKKERIFELIETVNLNEELLFRYPHELSGGQIQRVVIARILSLNPKFIVADEPTSMLDVSVQAQILNLLKDLQKKYGISYLFISHDLEVVEWMSDEIAIMHKGKLVELGRTSDIFNGAKHPYTQALLSAIPVPDPEAKREKIVLGGELPNPINPPSGCRFHTRCPYRERVCEVEEPMMIEIEDGHQVACHLNR